MNRADRIFRAIETATFFVSAGIWIYVSLIDVPNNIDTIVAELQRAAYWNAWAAFFAGVAAACAAWKPIRDLGWL